MISEVKKSINSYLDSLNYLSKSDLDELNIGGYLYFNNPKYNNEYCLSKFRFNQIRYKMYHSFYKSKLSQFMVVKGIDLIDRSVYQDAGERFFSDLDLYGPNQDYIPELIQPISVGKKWSENTHKKEFCYEENGFTYNIEVHRSLFPVNTDLSQSFSLEIYFIYLIYHYINQHNFQKLFWFIDILLFYERYRNELDINKVKQYATDLKLEYLLSILSLISTKFLGKNFFFGITTKHSIFNKFIISILPKNFLLNNGKVNSSYFLARLISKGSLINLFSYTLKRFS